MGFEVALILLLDSSQNEGWASSQAPNPLGRAQAGHIGRGAGRGGGTLALSSLWACSRVYSPSR